MSYSGIYCEQCNEWMLNVDGRLMFYPAPEIAAAHLSANASAFHCNGAKVVEFGTEKPVAEKDLPAGTPLCAHIVNDRVWSRPLPPLDFERGERP